MFPSIISIQAKINRLLPVLTSLVFIVLSGYSLPAQDYLWPTNASNFVSSSFCEFREGHYHAAIDIKTWLREGFPCFAVADGHIERIRISPFGYGKVIYLKLNDGNTAVYAHLQKFAAPLEKIVRHWQVTHHTYSLDLSLDTIQFKKGDVIAYNGGTGAGPPHLHFEIRNPQDHPVNPLHFYPQYQDPLPPGLKSLICIPLTRGSTINGSYLPQKFQLIHAKDGQYKVQKPIHIKGSVGLGIKGFDQAVELGNSFGFYQTLLLANSDTIFNIRYDELNFDETAYIYTEIYYPQWIKTGEVYHKLYIEDFNRLNLYEFPQQKNGIIKMGVAPIPISILVKDIRSNSSVIHLDLFPDSSAYFYAKNLNRQDDWVYLTLYADRCQELFFQTGKSLAALQPVKYYEIIDGQISAPEAGIKIKININDSLNTLLKIMVRSSVKRQTEQTFWIRSDNTLSLKKDPEFNFLGCDLILRFNHLSVWGKIWSETPQTDFVLQRSNTDWSEAIIPGSTISGERHTIKYGTPPQPLWSKDIEMYNLYPAVSQTISWFDSSLTLTTAAESVLDTVLITADSSSAESVKLSLPAVSPLYQLSPLTFPIFGDFFLQIKADSLPPGGKWSIYQIEHSGKISYLPGKTDLTNLILSTRASSFGKFMIASDTIPPNLDIITPQNGQEYSGNPKIKLKLDDLQSGIGDEQNIALAVDGNYVVPEWDPEKKAIVTVYDETLAPGAHTFTAAIKDRSGNMKRQAVYFTITGRQKKNQP